MTMPSRAAAHLYDLAECADVGDEFADFRFGGRQLTM